MTAAAPEGASMSRARIGLLMGGLAVLLSAAPAPAWAQAGECRVVDVAMTPSDDLQIAVWIEDAAGNYVDTAFLTRSVGSYGLGNRPGIPEFNSGPRWPYGRRITTFPVWAHRHGLSWPLVVFQNWEEGDPLSYVVEDPNPRTTPEENLSHPLSQSSKEAYYCRPLLENESAWDAESCATSPGVFTDKGRFHPSATSLYPPRSDLAAEVDVDSDDVAAFAGMNPFDQVSRATPIGGEPFVLSWAIPPSLPPGDYVVWVEVAKERDPNAVYDRAPYGESDLMWGQYGVPYLGQPSVVYSVPVTIGEEPEVSSQTTDYVGYGDPDGIDGELRDPDMTITTDVPGSGASRLQLVSGTAGTYRVHVTARNQPDEVAPGAVEGLAVLSTSTSAVSLTFAAAGDDGAEGMVHAYEIRYLAGRELSEDNWNEGTLVSASIEATEPGLQVDVVVEGLLPRTNYYIGVRAVDECLNQGPVRTILATTPVPTGGTVDACFVATAAYGAWEAGEVTDLRRFRDRFLRTHVTGELLVGAYYTFGPAMARVIEPSEMLRALARAALSPTVRLARTWL